MSEKTAHKKRLHLAREFSQLKAHVERVRRLLRKHMGVEGVYEADVTLSKTNDGLAEALSSLKKGMK